MVARPRPYTAGFIARVFTASETSSASSPPPKPAVRLPAKGGRSAIRVTTETQEDDVSVRYKIQRITPRTIQFRDTSDSNESRTVSIFIDRIYIPEFSRLLHPSFDNVKVYVDWWVMDYHISGGMWWPI